MYFFIYEEIMITKQACENIILEQYKKDPSQFKDSPSLFIQKSRGDNKESCFSYFNNSPLTLKEFLENSNKTNITNSTQENNQQNTQETIS